MKVRLFGRPIAGGAAVIALALGATSAESRAEIAWALTLQDRLISFDTNNPSNLIVGYTINNLQPNERMLAIDFGPGGELYGIGTSNTLYRISTSNGAATVVGSVGAINPGLSGANFGFTYERTANQFWTVSTTDQVLVLNSANGSVVSEPVVQFSGGTPLEGQDPVISALAQGLDGRIYALDSSRGALLRGNTPFTGSFSLAGEIPFSFSEVNGFDISPQSGVAYAVLQPNGTFPSVVYSVNLANGTTTNLGLIGGGLVVTSMAVIPAPGAGALLAVAGLVAGVRRRR